MLSFWPLLFYFWITSRDVEPRKFSCLSAQCSVTLGGAQSTVKYLGLNLGLCSNPLHFLPNLKLSLQFQFLCDVVRTESPRP